MNKSKKTAGSIPPSSTKSAPRSKGSGVRALLDTFENSIDDETTISVTEYIRLVQLEREIKAEEPMDVEVLWIERLDDPSEGAD